MTMIVDAAFAGGVRRDGSGARDPLRASALDDAVGLLAEAERLRSEAVAVLGRFEGSGLAEFCGYPSLARLLAHRVGLSNAEGRSLVEVGAWLEAHPATGQALAAGRVTMAQVEVMARAARGVDASLLGEFESLLLAAADDPDLGVDGFARLCSSVRHRLDRRLAIEDGERSHRQRGLWVQRDLEGGCRGGFRLDPVAAETVLAALETRPDPAASIEEPRSLAQRRADRLVDVCHDHLIAPEPTHHERIDRDRLDHQPGERADVGAVGRAGAGPGGWRAGREARPRVDVVIDVETLAGGEVTAVERLRSELGSGAPISGPGLDRLLCDASYRALITDGPRQVLAYNRATPDIPPALRRAVQLRDRHCQFHGCDRPWRWCDLHHLLPRHCGGPTTADNLTLVCRHHHTTIHEGGWHLTRAPDGRITTTSP